MSKRKYKPTNRICSLADFENSKALWFEVRYGNRYRMWHRAALESLQVHTLMNFIRRDYLFACEKVVENGKQIDY